MFHKVGCSRNDSPAQPGWIGAGCCLPLTVGLAIFVAAPAAAVEFRSIDGTGNNTANPDWGSTGIHLLRQASGAHYTDGLNSPARSAQPSPRHISNEIFAQSTPVKNNRYLSDFVWQWGQFVDHDIDLTQSHSPAEPFNIPVPPGDPWFDPTSTGTAEIPLSRAAYDPTTGITDPRQQINQITAYIDASNVYGSDTARADWLRANDGSGKLKITDHGLLGDLLPFNDTTQANAGGPGTDLFLAGDVRANEQVGLTAMHTLFVREHNRLAEQIAMANPALAGNDIYQRARQIVGAQIQAITYNEFLPALLGTNAIADYAGYNPTTDASISNAFATAAYRLGHSMLSPQLLRLDDLGNVIPDGNLALRDAFFNPTRITDEGGIDPLLKGLASQKMQEIEPLIIDDIRNFMFGLPGSGGLDLVSLNIQRGRDHGLADYNTLRIDFGLLPVTDFDQITSDPVLAAMLELLYGDVNSIDPWVGGLAEDHLPNGSVGQLFTTIIADQFQRLRDGDRFWYELTFDGLLLDEITNTTLADIIRRNTRITRIQDNVFFYYGGVPEPATAVLSVMGLATLVGLRRRV